MLKKTKIIQYGLLLTAFLPLFFTPFTFFPWHFGKTIIFQLLIEILVITCFLSFQEKEFPGRSLKSLNYLDWSVLFFLFFVCVTALAGVNPANSFWGSQDRTNGLFVWWHFIAYYFLLKIYFQGQPSSPTRREERIVVFSVGVSILAALTSIFPQILPTSWQSIAGGGIIGNRAFLANYLVLAAGLSAFCFTLFKSRWCWLFAASAAFLVYSIYLTGNRGALLGLLVGIFFGLLFSVFVIKHRTLRFAMSSVVIILIVSCSVFLFSQKDKLINSLTSGTGETRLLAWNIAWQGIVSKPLGAWGWGNYATVFDKFYNPQLLKYSFGETVWDKPHNWFLEIGVTGGMLAALAYLAVLTSAGYYFLKNKNFILCATLIGGFVANLFLFETTNSLLLWFLLLALASTARSYSLSYPEANLVALAGGKKIKNRVLMIVVAVVAACFFFGNLYFLRYSYFMRRAELSTVLTDWIIWSQKALAAPAPFKWENAVFLAQQFTKFDKADAIANREEIKEAALSVASALDQVGRKYPLSLAYPVWSGQVYMVLGEKFDKKYYIDAEQTLNRAVSISPQKQEVHFLLGRLYLLQQDFVRALEQQRVAVDIAPEIASSHWFYGLALVASGNTAGGLVEIEKAVESGHFFTPEQTLYVLDLYAMEKDYPRLIQEYKKLIEREPENLNWYIKLATVYAVSGDKKQALKLAEQILSQAPQLKSEVENFIQEYKLK